MRRVASDSDVIIHLAKLNKVKLIRKLYGCAHIPKYVELEMVQCQYDEVDTIRQGILKVYETSDSRARNIAERYGIHIGEGHVKELAEKLQAEIFISNERKVRTAAKDEGFSVVGTIGVILRGVKENCLTREEAVGLLHRLRAGEFRIHPSIIDRALNSLKGM